MSNNRSASTKKINKTMSDRYNEFFVFLRDTFIVPVLPLSIKTNPAVNRFLASLDAIADDPKTFAFLHYGVVAKIVEDPNSAKTLSDIALLTSGTDAGKLKMQESVKEIRDFAQLVHHAATTILEASDEEISDKLESLCLYAEILTSQFKRK